MKAKLLKFLRLVGYVVPTFLELVKKLALGLIKKLTALVDWVCRRLSRVKQVCDCSETIALCIEEGE